MGCGLRPFLRLHQNADSLHGGEHYDTIKRIEAGKGREHYGAKTPVSVLHGGAAACGDRLPPLREDFRGMQPGGLPAGGHGAGRALHRGRDAQSGRRGCAVQRRGESGRLPGDHQGVPACHPFCGAGGGLHPAPQAGERSTVQDHPHGFCRPVPRHPARYPRQRSGSRAGCGGSQQHRVCSAGKPRRHTAGAVAGKPPRPGAGRGCLRHAAPGV